MKNLLACIVLVSALFMSPFTVGAEHVVKLLTSGENGQTMVMSPGYLKIVAGDSVTFVPADSSHNAESVSIPEGAEKFNTPMGQKATLTFNKEGVYLYKCTPHFALGMLGVIQVGNATNLDKVKADWSGMKAGVAMNKERVDGYIAEAK